VFRLLLSLQDRRRKDYQRLAGEFGVPRSTIMRRHERIKSNPAWTPADTHWGERWRIFDDQTEATMASFIRTNFTHNHRLFTSEDFQTLAFAHSRMVYRDVEVIPRFCCSRTFIHGFVVRIRFSVRREHFKRRAPISAEEVAQWTEQLRHLLATENNDLILNCDETAWRVYPGNILTGWDTGADDVCVHVDGHEKSSITVLATLSASHNKWPLFFVAKGKTGRVERSKVGDVGDNWRFRSESGWMSHQIFGDDLPHLRAQMPNGDRILLVCDVPASHRTQNVKELAAELNIELFYIPSGATDTLRPLDRKIFGAPKSEARRLFR
jgi:hypothetical protein